MAIVWHQNADSRQQKFISNIMATNATTYTYGQALIVSSTTGRWVTAVAGGPIGGIYNGPTKTTGTNEFIEVIEVRPGDEFEADYVNSPNAAFLPGQSTANLDGTALNVDAANVTSGPFALLLLNTVKSKVIVRVKNRQFS